MKDYKGYIFDMDGVIYRGDEIISDAVRAINILKQNGKKVLFVTNNSSKTDNEYWSKLIKIGVTPVNECDIITSGDVTVIYLKNQLKENPSKKNILCVAGSSVRSLLIENGLNVIDPKEYRNADYVIVGFNTDFTWELGNYAVNAVAIYGAKLIGTNPDIAKPVENNEIAAGTGSIISFIETASQTKAIIMGKPFPEMYKVALDRMKLEKNETLMVGDLLITDIKGANDFGMDSALVLTGMHNKKDIERLGIVPTYVIESLMELIL